MNYFYIVQCFIIIIISLINNIFSVKFDYCKDADFVCSSTPHILCKDNILDRNGVLIEIDFYQKYYLLERFNELRNNIALGHLNNFEKSANILITLWDHELSKFAEKAVLISHFRELCHAHGLHKLENIFFTDDNDTPLDKFLHLAADRFFKFTQKSVEYSLYFNATTNKIGCAVGTERPPEDNKKTIVCFLNQQTSLTTDVYEVGNPASSCKQYKTKPSDTHRGLCGTIGQRGPKGLKGMKGDLGDDGSKGNAGVNGDKGFGPIGQKGEPGDIGSEGYKGYKGQKGEKGDLGPDNKGSRGPPGPKGNTGIKGLPGETGPRGDRGDDFFIDNYKSNTYFWLAYIFIIVLMLVTFLIQFVCSQLNRN